MIMIIKIKSKIISSNAKFAKSFLDKNFGLLDTKNPRVLLFKTRFGIHTIALKDPIDVLVLDKDFQVVKLKENLKPNSLFFWNPKHFWLLELPPGTIKRFNIKPSEELNFDPRPSN